MQDELQITDEVIIMWSPPSCGWIVAVEGIYVNVFIGDAIIHNVQRSHIQLKDRAKSRARPIILETIAQVLDSQNIPNQSIPRLDTSDIREEYQQLISELVHCGCNYVAFRNYYITTRMLEEKMEELEKKAKSEQKSGKGYQKKISHLKKQLEDIQKKNIDMELELQQEKVRQIKVNEDAYLKIEKNRKKQNEEISDFKQEFYRMQAEKKAAEERIANAEYEVEAISKARDELKEELRKQTMELHDLTRGLTETESVRSNVEDDNLRLKKDVEEFKLQQISFLEKYERLERQLTNITGQLKEKAYKLDKLTNEKNQHKLENETLEEVIKLNTKLTADNEENEDKLSTSKRMLQDLTDQNLKLKKEVEDLYNAKTEIVKKYEKGLKDGGKKSTQLAMLNSEYAQRISSLEKENQNLELKLVRVNETIYSCLPELKSGILETNLKKFVEFFKETLSMRIQLKEKLDRMFKEIEEREIKINELNKQIRSQNKTIDDQIGRNQQLLRQQKNTIKEYEEELTEQENLVSEQKNLNSGMMSKISSMNIRFVKFIDEPMRLKDGDPVAQMQLLLAKLEQKSGRSNRGGYSNVME